MQWNHEQQAKGFYDQYVESLTKSHLMAAAQPLANQVSDYWKELTGHEQDVNGYLGNLYMYVDMGEKMDNGEYPTKAYHLALLLEFIEDLFYYRFDRKRGRRDTVDSDDHNFSWYGSGNFPNFDLHASHGGNCRLVKTNRRMEEVFDYETVCDD